MPNAKYHYKNLLMTKEDQEVAKFIHKKLGGTLSFAMKTAMRKYAVRRGWEPTKVKDEK